jgi:hypothetical protein
MDWSYNLLTEKEKDVFHALGVFNGAWTRRAACAVYTGNIAYEPGETRRHNSSEAARLEWEFLDLLASLVDKSLVTMEAETEGEPHYQLLETLRQYNREQLNQLPLATTLYRRHLAWYLALVEHAEPKLQGPEQQQWLNCLEREHDNLRAALAWALQANEIEAGLKLAAGLWRFWYLRGYYTEGTKWLTEMLRQAENADVDLRAKALNGAGNIAYIRADYATARMLFEEALRIRREIGDVKGIIGSLGSLANLAHAEQNETLARDLLEESLKLSRQIHDTHSTALTLANLALVASCEQKYEEACDRHRESLEMFRAEGDLQNIALALTNMSNTLLKAQDLKAIPSLVEESLEIYAELGNKRGIVHCLAICVSLGIVQQQMQPAVALMAAASALRERIHYPGSSVAISEEKQNRAQLREKLGEAEFQAAWERGYAMTIEQAVAYARELFLR